MDNSPKVTYKIGPRALGEAEIVQKLYSQYQRAKVYDQKNWNRWQKNVRFHWGIDNDLGLGQWPTGVVADLMQQGRQVGTFNLCRPTVNNFAGDIMQAPFGFKFSPIDGAENSTTQKINAQIYIDKDVCAWKATELEMVVGGLIMRSDIEMYVNKNFPPKDYVGLRVILPGMITYDPDWKDSKSQACKWCDKESYLSAEQILEIYGTDPDKRGKITQSILFAALGKDALKALAEWEAKYGADYGDNTGAIPYQDRPEIWGSRYKVIEHFEMKIVKKRYEYAITETGDEISIPDMGDVAAKVEWLNTNVPGWIPDQIFEETIDEKVQYVTAYCPGLSVSFCLASGPTEIQCGRLQFFPWSAYRMYGEYGGIIDAIIDAQETINYWESMVIHKLQVDGGSGSQFMDPSAFESEGEADRYIAERNNPRAVFRMRKDALRQYPNGPAVPTMKASFPNEAYQHLQHIIEMLWPKLSGITPASRGEAESAQESGVLYNQKKLQAQVERMVVHESLRTWYNELGEAYLYQTAHMRAGKRMEFFDRKTKQPVVWNDRQIIRDDVGNEVEVIIDDITSLKRNRHKVDIIESADSPSRRDEVIRTVSVYARSIPATQPLTLMELTHEIAKNIDVFDEEQKAQLDADYEKERVIAEQQIKTNLVKLQLEEAAATMQLMQMQQQIAAMQAGVQPGMPQQSQPGGSVDGAPAPEIPNQEQAVEGMQEIAPEQQMMSENSQMIPQESGAL